MKQQLMDCQSWEARYRLIIQLGKQLERPSEQELATMSLIEGCEAQLWFSATPCNDTYHFRAYSEARIMNGLLWILLQELESKNAEQLKQFQLTAFFSQLGITQRLSATRLNGLKQIEAYLHQL
ncbi:hypothetical protein GVX81_05215 [[Haemophilus] felis]|uniref:Fe-S metabolism associated domain-containing protein n=1 Tax=[Haemophilus] felis TaxID=123822 RepID=A0A1T0AZS6_9PAST|nr:hypothetical protein [[Haemophilus] felis]NBI40619.1 hypothetical protein [[Haemophilus] felis]OOS02981.1 hypothetical protein B0188_07115 [[Haemophilus] felis]